MYRVVVGLIGLVWDHMGADTPVIELVQCSGIQLRVWSLLLWLYGLGFEGHCTNQESSQDDDTTGCKIVRGLHDEIDDEKRNSVSTTQVTGI